MSGIDEMFANCENLVSIHLGDNFHKLTGEDMFNGCTSLKAILTTRTNSMKLLENDVLSTGLKDLSDVIIYVPSETAEKTFEAADNYADVLGLTDKDETREDGTTDLYRVRPILELIGEKNMKIRYNGEFTEEGITVAKTTINSDNKTYTPYGYTVLGPVIKRDGTDVTEVSMTTPGTYTLTYTIYNSSNKKGMDAVRTVIVKKQPVLMERDNTGLFSYVIGIYHRCNYAQVNSTSVRKIVIKSGQDEPEAYKNAADNERFTWDVSYTDGDETVTAWLVPNDEDNTMYDLYIGADLGTGVKIMAPEDSGGLFASYSGCLSIDGLEYLDTSDTTDMSSMFKNCRGLESLELTNFDTSNVTDMGKMFEGCSSLTSLDVSKFITNNVELMNYMFNECSSLADLNITNFITSKVTDMCGMFKECSSLGTLNVCKFDTSNVEIMNSMFYNCSSLENLDITNFVTNKVTSMEGMFEDCRSLRKLDLDVTNFDTGNVTEMSHMFAYCNSLKSINVSKFDTSNVLSLGYMFYCCSSLESLDVSKFDTRNVEFIDGMFYGCNKLTDLDVSNFVTNNVFNMEGMFAYCSNLTRLDVTNFNTTNVITMDYMFYGCRKLTSLDLRSFDLENTKGSGKSISDDGIDGMFTNCESLISIHLGDKFDKLTGGNMFDGCMSLKAILTTRTDSMRLLENDVVSTGLKDLPDIIIYVPNETAEKTFEAADNYADVLGLADKDESREDGTTDLYRIKPILALIGDSTVRVQNGDPYVDAGVTVAGMEKSEDNTYTPYGYTTIVKGFPEFIETGLYRITYTIVDSSGRQGMSVERALVVMAGEYLMGRESGTAIYVLGAKRQSEKTGEAFWLNYTADKVKTITLISTEKTSAPTNAIATWDVSKKYDDKKITAWLVVNSEDSSMFDLILGSAKKMIASSGNNLFANYSNCVSLNGLELLDTENTTDMTNMFSGLESLTALEVEKISTNAASTMSGMFKNCKLVTSLNLSNMLTIMCTNMKEMFKGCTNVNGLNVSKFYTVNVTDMSGMFDGCSNVESLDVKYFDTSNVESFASMFNGCSKLTEIDVKDFVTSKAKSVGAMFKDCSSLEMLDLSNFNLTALDGATYTKIIENVKDINQNFMFDGCSSLDLVVLGKKFMRMNGIDMFRNCDNLSRVIVQSETPLELGTDTGLESLVAKLYVPKQANVATYSSATNYATVFTTNRIKGMLEIIGDNPVQVPLDSVYVDEGATVAGYTIDEKAKYEELGYTLETLGMPVDTSEVGTEHVIYKLYYFDQTIDTASN